MDVFNVPQKACKWNEKFEQGFYGDWDTVQTVAACNRRSGLSNDAGLSNAHQVTRSGFILLLSSYIFIVVVTLLDGVENQVQ
jgi:hypothetical protein